MPSIPTSSTDDYIPTARTDFVTGDVLFMTAQKLGTVLAALDSGGGVWVYAIDELHPDGTTSVGGVPFIEGSLAGTGYDYMAVAIGAAKPDKAALFTATGGSKWIYPDDGTGQYLCYFAGTGFVVNQRADRADIPGLVAV